MQFIELHDVKKEYRMGEVTINAADGMTFSVNKGELAVIVGPSGSGKTTVLNMLGGMDQPSEGTVTVAGREVSSMNDKQLGSYRADVIGFIFQFYNLLPSLTAHENIGLVKSIVKNAGNGSM